MNMNEYQQQAMRTNDGRATERMWNYLDFAADYNFRLNENMDAGGILNACLGLSGEVGELNDMVKKMIFHDKATDMEHLKKEVGDVMWYIAMFCHSMGWDMADVAEMNVEKLRARYPYGFDTVRSNNRAAGDV